MKAKSGERGPLQVEFVTWREAIAHLRSRVLLDGVAPSTAELGELLANRIAKGSARSWTGWLRGQGDVRVARADAEVATRELASLWVKHWPTLVRGGQSTREAREATVARVAAALAELPRHPGPGRTSAPISGASLQAIVTRHLEDHALRHEDLAAQLSARLRSDPSLSRLVEQSEQAPIEAWHVQRVASGAGLDLDRTAYYLLVRGFALTTGHAPDALFALPFASPDVAPQWGAFLQVRLDGLSGAEHGAAVEAFRVVANGLLTRVVAVRLTRRPDRYRDFDTRDCPVLVQVNDTHFEVALRLKPRIEPPAPGTFGPILLLLSEYARQVRLAWALHEVNTDLLCAGESPTEVAFSVHAGIRSNETAFPPPGSTLVIGFSPDAYAHARSTDLRVIWDSAPLKSAVPSRSRTSIAAAPAEGAPPDVQFHGVKAFQSHIYFGEAHQLGLGAAPRGRCVDVADARPRDTFFRTELATHLFQRRKFREALGVAESVVALDVRHPTAWALVSVCFANLARNLDRGRAQNVAAHFDSVSRFYHRALCAAQLALDADPSQEDAYDACGCLHLLRGLDCFRWYDEALVDGLRESREAAELTLLQAGFDWAKELSAMSVAQWLRRAGIDDVIQARRYFDQGLAVSATKSRSFFWRLVADALLGAITGGADMRKSRLLAKLFVELGWVSDVDDDAAVLEVLSTKIEEYDGGLLLESYLPEVQLAYAVAYWDFNDPSRETARRAREHLERGQELLREHQAGYDSAQIVRCWGFLEPASSFARTVNEALGRVAAWESSGTYIPLFPLYLGEVFSRSFERFLGSLARPSAA